MVGIPGRARAPSTADTGEFTLLMNHEITAGAPGVVRAHGSTGAFVSRWTIDAETLRGQQGPGPHAVAQPRCSPGMPATGQYVAGTTQWQRFCSADLPNEGAFYAQRPGHARAHLHGRRGSHRGPRLGAGRDRPPRRRSLAAAAHGPDGLRERGRLSVSAGEDDRRPDRRQQPQHRADASDFPSEVYVYVGTQDAPRPSRWSRPASPTARSSA